MPVDREQRKVSTRVSAKKLCVIRELLIPLPARDGIPLVVLDLRVHHFFFPSLLLVSVQAVSPEDTQAHRRCSQSVARDSPSGRRVYVLRALRDRTIRAGMRALSTVLIYR